MTFPRQRSCPRCTSEDVHARELATRGELWSWTIQCFAPKAPPYLPGGVEEFEPYGVGYIELPGEIRVEARLTESDPERLHIGMTMELTLIPVPGAARQADLRLPAGRGGRVSGGDDVAVVGVGIHAFGRHDGVSGLEMGAIAARRALADAGIAWQDVDFAAGGSDAAGNADTSVSMLGLTGVPFINVKNGCATGGSALTTAHAMLVSGAAEVALVVGFDKHPRGAFNPLPEEWGIGSWYGETGLMLTTQFFALKIQRYMAEHGITPSTLAKVAAKAFANGSRNPNAWRRTPLSEDEILSSRMVNHPLTQYMFCSPGEGAVALVLARGARIKELTRHAGVPTLCRVPYAALRLVRGVQPVDPDRVRTLGDYRGGRGRVRGGRGRTRRRRRRADSGHRVRARRSCTWPRPGCASTASRRRSSRAAPPRLGGRLPVNTDGGCLACGEPIGASGLRQVHEVVLQLRGEAGERQVPKACRVGFTQVYGAPGVSACTVLTV